MQEDLPVRKRIRLNHYDYSQDGCYFITICVKDKYEMLGKIDVGAITNRPQPTNDLLQNEHGYVQTQLSEYGVIVDNIINEISIHYPKIIVDQYVIMPNHIHMILVIWGDVDIGNDGENSYRSIDDSDSGGRLVIAPTISRVVKQFKMTVSKQIGFSLWQKSFYDRIIRDKQEYEKISKYIYENPIKWAEDEYYS